MQKTTLTIAKIVPADGNKSGKIVGTNGESISAYANTLAQLRVGATYEIEYTTREWEGRTFKNLKSFSEAPGAAASVARSVAASPPVAQNTYRQTDPTDAERMFVVATLGALIKAGQVTKDKGELLHTTNMLRWLWGATFGADAGTVQRQARG